MYGYDRRVDPGPKLVLSRTAQRDVFALWVYGWGTIGRRLVSPIPRTCCRPAGRMNARTADRAAAWFQEMDWLETARSRGEPSHHRICDHHAGTHLAGRRYRRDPDCADGSAAALHRARRAVRGGGVLHADIL